MGTSVIIANWNGRDLLAECLPSLQAQTIPAEEIILVDNGSTDDSIDFVQSSFPRAVVISLDQNYGFAKANNIGIRQAVGSRIALLNNDTVADQRWLQELNRALDEHPEVGFCASKMLNYWERGIIDAAGDVLGAARARKRGHGQPDGPEFSEPAHVFGACAGAAIYRRAMLDDIGLLDETFVSNLEDVDISFRAQLAGYQCLYVPTATVYHKLRVTKRRMGWTDRLTYRNEKLMWLKNAPTELLIKYAPSVFCDEGKRWIHSLGIRRRALPHPNLEELKMLLTVNVEALLLLPETMRKRREIRRTRVVSTEYIEAWLVRETRQ
jgi:GT2 family glycosyltransferase